MSRIKGIPKLHLETQCSCEPRARGKRGKCNLKLMLFSSKGAKCNNKSSGASLQLSERLSYSPIWADTVTECWWKTALRALLERLNCHLHMPVYLVWQLQWDSRPNESGSHLYNIFSSISTHQTLSFSMYALLTHSYLCIDYSTY